MKEIKIKEYKNGKIEEITLTETTREKETSDTKIGNIIEDGLIAAGCFESQEAIEETVTWIFNQLKTGEFLI